MPHSVPSSERSVGPEKQCDAATRAIVAVATFTFA